MKKHLFLSILIAIGGLDLFAQSTEEFVYKTTPTRELTMKVYKPQIATKGKKLPAIVFFFGGGWEKRNLSQFERHAEHLSKKGMVCFIADYRVGKTDGIIPPICVMDAKSAMRYIHKNAERFGISTSQIIASGGSAGGHLAASTYYIERYNDPKDDLTISCKPSALVLYNPVIDNSNGGYGYDRVKDYFPYISPVHNIKSPIPTIFFVGSEDKLIPPYLAQNFKNICEKNGGRCDLHIFEGKDHGFFNQDEDYKTTIKLTEEFIRSIGYIK